MSLCANKLLQCIIIVFVFTFSEEEARKILQGIPIIPAYIFQKQSVKGWYVPLPYALSL